jgi:hypothetical protein
MNKLDTTMGASALKCQSPVMAGLVPAIHADGCMTGSRCSAFRRRETGWSFETGAALHGVDARSKSGHDGDSSACALSRG